MRKFILPLIASLACATPALASDTRVEVRGGAIWSNGTTEATYGAAAGIDFDLAPMVFAGVEVSADKIDESGTKVAFGATGRLGVKRPRRPDCSLRAATPPSLATFVMATGMPALGSSKASWARSI